MNKTLGEPGFARSGRGHAGLDSSVVRPITPGNAVPGSYSVSPIARPPSATACRRQRNPSLELCHPPARVILPGTSWPTNRRRIGTAEIEVIRHLRLLAEADASGRRGYECARMASLRHRARRTPGHWPALA